MSVLSDKTISEGLSSGRIVIDPPPSHSDIQPASVDLHLAWDLRMYDNGDRPLEYGIDVKTSKLYPQYGYYDLKAGQFLLGSTLERIEVPRDLVASVEGKSSLGRMGLAIHVTAGYIDPGFKGNITLEMKNMNNIKIRLRPGMKIAQIRFFELTTESQRPYGSVGLGSRYQDSIGTVPARKGD